MPSVSIIGTAGRNGYHTTLNKEIFSKMCTQAVDIIENNFKISWDNVHLMSGGAAWADHVAVRLFTTKEDKKTTLTLHMPCAWKDGKFEDTGVRDWRKNPGYTANNLHKLFSEIMEEDTLHEIEIAKNMGANIIVGKGFHNRNTQVAKSDYVIAFTWGKKEPEAGGTLDTWKKSKGMKVHVSLHEL